MSWTTSTDTPIKNITRHQSLDSPETLLFKRQKTEGDLGTRTVYVTGSPATHSSADTGRTSPLKRFRLAKDSIYRAFGLIKDQLNSASSMLSSYHGNAKQEQMTSLLNKTRGIEDMLARDHMKVAFFGRTSNGKSTVVNALLRDKVLPTGIGHTTSCFCSVTGIDEPSGYITIPGSSDRKEIKSLQLLAHSLHKERLSTDSLVNVYWPKNKCPILQEDVEFVDSPGIDMNPDVDKWINDHCLNADVFVLVSNAESTLMNAEKNFFYRVSERLSRPNLFILNNRWDASAQEEPSLMEEVKQQHMENDVSFLSQVTDPSAAKERVYFISAKEVLTLRTREETEEKDKGKGLADGYKARLMEFERFEDKFKACLSSSAIRTKFEQHHSRGMEIVSELAQLLENEEKEAVERNAAVNAKLQSTCSRLQELNEKGHLTYNLAREKAVEMASEVEQRVQSSMKDLMQHITNVIDEYKHKDDFDPTKSDTYKNDLYCFIDDQLQQKFNQLCPVVLSAVHQEACNSIVSAYSQLLNEPLNQMVDTYKLDPPEVTHNVRCRDLCGNFREDLEFRFTLGIFSLMKWVNAGNIMYSVQRRLSGVTSVVPAELLVPVSLLGGGIILSRLLSWHYLWPPTLIYVGIYAYEHFTWTDKAKENRLKKQLAGHLTKEFNKEVLAVKTSFKNVLLNDLHRLIDRLNLSFNSTQNDCEGAIADLRDEEHQLGLLQGQIRTLRNSVILIKRDMDNFKDEYLD